MTDQDGDQGGSKRARLGGVVEPPPPSPVGTVRAVTGSRARQVKAPVAQCPGLVEVADDVSRYASVGQVGNLVLEVPTGGATISAEFFDGRSVTSLPLPAMRQPPGIWCPR